MVCLLRSALFRETRLPVEEFEDTFDRSPVLLLEKADGLWSFLEACHFFMVDDTPFDGVRPFRDRLLTTEPHNVPRHLASLHTSLCTALAGERGAVLQHGDDQVVRWVHLHRFPFETKDYMTLFDAQHGDATLLRLVRTFFSMGVRPDSHTFEVALRRKRIPIVSWLLEQRIDLTSYHLSVAIQEKYPMPFLERWVENKFPVHSHTVAMACSRGLLDVVKWWHEKELPFCPSAMAWAALWGQRDVVRFLILHNKPRDASWTRSNAHRSNDVRRLHVDLERLLVDPHAFCTIVFIDIPEPFVVVVDVLDEKTSTTPVGLFPKVFHDRDKNRIVSWDVSATRD